MRKIVEGVKDATGSFLPLPKLSDPAAEIKKEEPVPDNISIDALLATGLNAIYRTMRFLMGEIASSAGPTRETIMNLKDVMTMLHDLKKKEQDLLDDISDEELEKMSRKK